MKRITIIIALAILVFPAAPILAAEPTLAKRLAGKVLLQVESYGRAWYIDPVSLRRYYLRNGEEAYNIMRSMGLGISDANLKKIPLKKGDQSNPKLVSQLKGRILLQVESHGEAWYVDPDNGLRYYLANGQAALDLMRSKGLGISNANLAKIKMNDSQLVQDTAFIGQAQVGYDGVEFYGAQNADQILAIASLTKLMTAMVFLDTNPEWSKQIVLTRDHLDYPKTLAGDDPTSEVDFAEGESVLIYDLWVAMLMASSNQAVIALVDASGLSRKEFVARMNIKAAELGLNKTVFCDPTGLDAHNVSTAKEMAKIAYVAFADERISQAGKLGQYMISALDPYSQPRQIKVVDRNYSLQSFEPEAVKTGFLVEAQRTVALRKGGEVIVVLHAKSMKDRNEAITRILEFNLAKFSLNQQ